MLHHSPIFCQGIHTYPIIMTYDTTGKRHTFKKQLPSESHTAADMPELDKIPPKAISYTCKREIVFIYQIAILIYHVGIMYHKNR